MTCMKYLVAHLCSFDQNKPTPKKTELPFFSLIVNVEEEMEPDLFTHAMLSCLEITPKLNSLEQMEKILEDAIIVWLN